MYSKLSETGSLCRSSSSSWYFQKSPCGLLSSIWVSWSVSALGACAHIELLKASKVKPITLMNEELDKAILKPSQLSFYMFFII
jgi:hypothetical protein